jgi:hypothetical protein
MSNHLSHPAMFVFMLCIGALTVSADANAKCGCPDDGNWNPKASQGLGQSFPETVDLAADPAWHVYEFERDGVRYTQINDHSGVVRAAAGRIGGTFWVMPIGADADRVSVPGDTMPSGMFRMLYRSNEVEVLIYQEDVRESWFIRPAVATK